MSLFQALVLGAVQGLTEFLPISSSAHLVLVPFALGWETPTLAFDVAVHIGTGLAVVAYFWKELRGLAVGTLRTLAGRGDDRDRAMTRLTLLLALGSVPAAIAGLFLQGFVEGLTDRPEVVAAFLLGTAAILLLGEEVYRRRGGLETRDMTQVGTVDAVLVGMFQAVAIIPGISRSGSTITGGILRGLSRDAAARFSFLLGLPAILGAAIVELPDLTAVEPATVVAATTVSAATGFAAIAFLLRYLRTRTMRPFAAYCVVASVLALALWFGGR
jgi:undecaprenyl-diphosphatase